MNKVINEKEVAEFAKDHTAPEIFKKFGFEKKQGYSYLRYWKIPYLKHQKAGRIDCPHKNNFDACFKCKYSDCIAAETSRLRTLENRKEKNNKTEESS